MPQYKVQDSETGKSLLLEGDSPPTEAELKEIFSKYKPTTKTGTEPAEPPAPTSQSEYLAAHPEAGEAPKFDAKAAQVGINAALGITGAIRSITESPAVAEASAMGAEQGRLQRQTEASDAADIAAAKVKVEEVSQKKGLIPRTGEASTLYGGPPKKLASYAETMLSMQEDEGSTLGKAINLIAPRPNPTEPRITIPVPEALTVKKDDSMLVAGAKETINTLKGVPEFFTSDLGIVSLFTAKLAPSLVSLGFSADLIKSAAEQAANFYDNWDHMTPAEKGVGITQFISTLTFAGLTGAHAGRGGMDVANPARPVARAISQMVKETGKVKPPLYIPPTRWGLVSREPLPTAGGMRFETPEDTQRREQLEAITKAHEARSVAEAEQRVYDRLSPEKQAAVDWAQMAEAKARAAGAELTAQALRDQGAANLPQLEKPIEFPRPAHLPPELSDRILEVHNDPNMSPEEKERYIDNELSFFKQGNREVVEAVQESGWEVLNDSDLRFLVPAQRAVYDAWVAAGKPEGAGKVEAEAKPAEVPKWQQDKAEFDRVKGELQALTADSRANPANMEENFKKSTALNQQLEDLKRLYGGFPPSEEAAAKMEAAAKEKKAEPEPEKGAEDAVQVKSTGAEVLGDQGVELRGVGEKDRVREPTGEGGEAKGEAEPKAEVAPAPAAAPEPEPKISPSAEKEAAEREQELGPYPKAPKKETEAEFRKRVGEQRAMHEVTKADAERFRGFQYEGGRNREGIFATPEAMAEHHKTQVEEAIKEGKHVPREVLADYPELAPKAEPEAAAPAPAPEQPASAGVPEGGGAKKTPSEPSAEDIDNAEKLIRTEGRASVSLLQRRFRLGYGKASRVMDELEKRGVVGPARGAQPREIFPPKGEAPAAAEAKPEAPAAAPEAAKPREFPKPPDLASPPEGATKEQKTAIFDKWVADTKEYEKELAAWEAEQPANKAIVFTSEGRYLAITKDPQGGWRSTSFSPLERGDNRLMPWGHELFKSRWEAVKESRNYGEHYTGKFPEVMSEPEIKAWNEKRRAEAEAEYAAKQAAANVPPEVKIEAQIPDPAAPIEEQVAAQQKLEPETTTTIDTSKADPKSYESDKAFPIAKIQMSKDVPNFKEGADLETGVVPEQKLEGEFDPLAAPITIWKRLNGDYEIITGRHRLDLAKRAGKDTIAVMIVDESKGFTKDMALTYDAEVNIRDGQGSVEDYAHYFKNSPQISEAQARQRGLLSRAKGKAGWDLGRNASDDLFAIWKSGKISESQAVAISKAAPGNADAQAVGIKSALEGNSPDFIANLIQASIAQAKSAGQTLETMDLFGRGDAALKASEAMAKRATEIQKELRDDILAISGASKRPVQAAKYGIDIKDPEAVKAKIAELKAEYQRWERWASHPDLLARAREEAGVAAPAERAAAPAVEEAPAPPAAPAAPEPDLFAAPAPKAETKAEAPPAAEPEAAAPEPAPIVETPRAKELLESLKTDQSGTYSPKRTRAYQELGAEMVPGLRMGDVEEAGRLYEMVSKGEATPAEWNKWVADAKASNRIREGEVAAVPKFAEGDRVMVMADGIPVREGVVVASGPRGGNFVRTNMGETFYEAKDLKALETPPPALKAEADIFTLEAEAPKKETKAAAPAGPAEVQGGLFGAEPKAEAKPKVQERALTKSEQREFADLSLKLKKQREGNGDPLTTTETQRYEYLSALAGQKDFGFAEPTGVEAARGKIKVLEKRLQALEESRPKTRGKRFEKWAEEYRVVDQELRDLRDQLTEGQGRSLGVSPMRESQSGYHVQREFRVRQLTDAEMRERYSDDQRMRMYNEYGERPYIAESRLKEYEDPEGKKLVRTNNWYQDGMAKTEEGAIADAQSSNTRTWGNLPKQQQPSSATLPPEASFGGALYGDITNPPRASTATKNAAIDADRADMGLPPMMSAMRKADPDLWAQVMNRIDNYESTRDESYPDSLIRRFKDNPFIPTDVELLALTWKRVDLKNTFNRAQREMRRAEEDGNPEMAAAAQVSRDEVLEKIVELDSITGKGDMSAGTMAGRALRARRIAMRENFELDEMISERRAYLGRGLKPDEMAELEKIAADYKELQDRLADNQKSLEAETQRANEAAAQAEVARIERDQLRREMSSIPRFARPVLDMAERIVAAAEAKAAEGEASVRDFFSGRRMERERGETKMALLPPSPIPADVLANLVRIGAARIMRASLNAAEFAAEMVGQFGEDIRPWLEDNWLYQRATERMREDTNPLPPQTQATIRRRAAIRRDTRSVVDRTTERIADQVGDFPPESRELAYRDLPPVERDLLYRDVQRLVRAYVTEGLRGWRPIADAITRDMRQTMADRGLPPWDFKDTVDMMGISPSKALSRGEIDVEMRKTKGEARAVRRIQQVIAGEPRKASGPEFAKPEDVERRYLQILEEVKKRFPEAEDANNRLQTALGRRKQYVRNRIQDLSYELAERKRIVRQRTAPPTDPELESLQAELANLREEEKITFAADIERAAIQKAVRLAEANEKIWTDRLERAQRGIYDVATGKRRRATSAELDAIRGRTEDLKAEVDRLKSADGLYQESINQDKLNASIEEYERRIRENDLFPEPKPEKGTTPLLDSLRMKREQLRADLRDAQRRSPEMIARAIDLARSYGDELQQRINEGDIAMRKRGTGATSPELEQLRAENAEMQKILRNLRDASRSQAELMDLRDEQIKKKIEFYKDKVARGDISTRPKKVPPPLSRETIKLNFDLNQIHRRWLDLRLKDKLKKRDTYEKTRDRIANVLRFGWSAMTTGEFSGVLRQGGWTAATRPLLVAKALKPMIDAFRSEQKQFEIMKGILTRDNAPLYHSSGLEFTDAGMRLSTMEEHYMFHVADVIKNSPGFRDIGKMIARGELKKAGKGALTVLPAKTVKFIDKFQRAYTTFLNQIRADSFDALVAANGKDEMTLKQIANYINVNTGRGSTGIGAKIGPGANAVLFAPRYTVSRFQLLLGQPAWRGNAHTRWMITKEYGRALASAAVLYSLANMAGASISLDPRSVEFGKIKIGKRRLDPLAGLGQATRIMAQMATGWRRDKTGQLQPLRNQWRFFPRSNYPQTKYGALEMGDELLRFGRSKASPPVGNVVSAAMGKDPTGRPYNIGTALRESFTPITYGDIVKTMMEDGIPEGVAASIAAIFGWGLQTY